MVKNKKGGSGHKKMARKNVKPAFIKRKLRKPEDPLEIFARVTSIHGGGHADVYCQDKKTRLLVIRESSGVEIKEIILLKLILLFWLE